MLFLALSALGILASILLLIYSLWGLYCNEKTAKQRLILIDFIFNKYENNHLLNDFNSVLYDDHLNALMKFKDPRKLYKHPLNTLF